MYNKINPLISYLFAILHKDVLHIVRNVVLCRLWLLMHLRRLTSRLSGVGRGWMTRTGIYGTTTSYIGTSWPASDCWVAMMRLLLVVLAHRRSHHSLLNLWVPA